MYTLTIHAHGRVTSITADHGANLRQTLLAAGISPYTNYTKRLNCHGRGLCATCGVWLDPQNAPAPEHWHDKIGHRFGYPRLSCQVTINSDLTIHLVDKLIWGSQATKEADTKTASTSSVIGEKPKNIDSD